jgi:hypothetical protein
MKTVFKYLVPLEDEVVKIDMPTGAVLRHVASQGSMPTMWFEVDPEAASELRQFKVIGTGHVVPEGWDYIGTVMTGVFVWHIYEWPIGLTDGGYL